MKLPLNSYIFTRKKRFLLKTFIAPTKYTINESKNL